MTVYNILNKLKQIERAIIGLGEAALYDDTEEKKYIHAHDQLVFNCDQIAPLLDAIDHIIRKCTR